MQLNAIQQRARLLSPVHKIFVAAFLLRQLSLFVATFVTCVYTEMIADFLNILFALFLRM